MSVKEALLSIYSHDYLGFSNKPCRLYMNRGDYIPDDEDLFWIQDLLKTIPHYFKLTCYLPANNMGLQEEHHKITHFLFCDTNYTFKYVSVWKYIERLDEHTEIQYNSLGRILQNIQWELIDSIECCWSLAGIK